MARMTDYGRRKLSEVTGTWLKDAVDWLRKEDCGCVHTVFDVDREREFCVCVGWTDETGDPKDGKERCKLAWKIGTQSPHNAMQTDLDIDFESPVDEETGMSEGTYLLEPLPKTKRDWEREAARIRKHARAVRHRGGGPREGPVVRKMLLV